MIVEKGKSKTSTKGNQYAVWTLSDLRDMQSGGVRLWLFGDALKKHWKLPVTATLAIINPAPFQDQQKVWQRLLYLSL